MRASLITLVIGVGILAAPQALAAKKFIPLGHSDLEQTANLPTFGSETSDFNLQADIYETNNYMRKKEARETDSNMRRFQIFPDANPANKYIDY